MAEITAPRSPTLEVRPSPWLELLRKEDWWAVWIGIGLILGAWAAFAQGASIKWVSVAPQKWAQWPELAAELERDASRYAALFVLWAVLFGVGAAALGLRLSRYLIAFAPLYLLALALYALGAWSEASHYNLEPPLVALALGLALANTVGVPAWLAPALRVEFYVKTGIVLLGASIPLTLLAWAGPVAMLQAALVSIATFAAIYFSAVAPGLDRRLAATLGAGGAVCGVSGAIAVGGAVGARRQEVAVAVALVVLWAIVMIFVLPIISRGLGLATGVAGAWIGTSEFADAAGLAAAQTYGGYAGHVPGIAGSAEGAVTAFTLMKVIGRDVWIGVWAFVLSLIAVTRWSDTGINRPADAAEIWRRFPKFVLGFLAASALVTLVARGYAYAGYKADVLPRLVAPLQALRTWAFTFAFLSIGLTTRVREFAAVGARPLYAFTVGVAVNVVLGFVLSTRVFAAFWTQLGQ